MILVGTFVANFFFDVNLMILIAIDGLAGLMCLRGAEAK
jgi:chromate transporter